MSSYESIKAQCQEDGKLWDDPEFPACQSSVFYHQTPPFQFTWKRATSIYENPVFISEGSEAFDVIPGKLGDKWLVSSLGVLYQYKGLFHRVVPGNQMLSGDYAGIFRFYIWWFGQWVEVYVDDWLPTVNGKLAFLQSSTSGELWPALLEKAYAKLHGSYEALKYVTLMEGLTELTGGLTEMRYNDPELFNEAFLHDMLEKDNIVTAHYCPPPNDLNRFGLEIQMNYIVRELIQVETEDEPLNLVRLQRPVAKIDVTKIHVIDDAIWMSITTRERGHLISCAKYTSSFWMLFKDFKLVFPRFESLQLDEETCMTEPLLVEQRKWHVNIYRGGWKRGVTAGGCRNHYDIVHINPQVQVVLNKATTIIVSLNQHKIMEPKMIGYSLIKLPAPIYEKAVPPLFKRLKTIMHSNYSNSRQISQRCKLEAAAYLIVPTTYEPREEAEFTLRIFSYRTLNVNVLDTHPRQTKIALLKAPQEADTRVNFGQYEAVFLHLADEHKTINTFELQELLDDCLPNEFIKSCATVDTCRQMVLAMDKNGTGRISLSDFRDLLISMHHWQQVFTKHTVEKMGVLRAERFKDALWDAGFAVPEEVMRLLVLRYMRKDGMLRFGDYVSAVLNLNRAFDVFYSKDILRVNNVNMHLAEWLQSSLMC